MNFLGVLYAIGTQVPRDYPMALYWFQKAIDRGSSDAMNNLARMYLVGMGVPRDYVNALRWFERSAAHGNVHSMFSVAVMARAPDFARQVAMSAKLSRMKCQCVGSCTGGELIDGRAVDDLRIREATPRGDLVEAGSAFVGSSSRCSAGRDSDKLSKITSPAPDAATQCR